MFQGGVEFTQGDVHPPHFTLYLSQRRVVWTDVVGDVKRPLQVRDRTGIGISARISVTGQLVICECLIPLLGLVVMVGQRIVVSLPIIRILFL